MKEHLTILLLALMLLATALDPAGLHADDCPEEDHCQTQLTQVYLPLIANNLPMSSTSSPSATPTPVAPPPVN